MHCHSVNIIFRKAIGICEKFDNVVFVFLSVRWSFVCEEHRWLKADGEHLLYGEHLLSSTLLMNWHKRFREEQDCFNYVTQPGKGHLVITSLHRHRIARSSVRWRMYWMVIVLTGTGKPGTMIEVGSNFSKWFLWTGYSPLCWEVGHVFVQHWRLCVKKLDNFIL